MSNQPRPVYPEWLVRAFGASLILCTFGFTTLVLGSVFDLFPVGFAGIICLAIGLAGLSLTLLKGEEIDEAHDA